MTAPQLQPFELPELSELLEKMELVEIPMRLKFRGIQTRQLAIFEGPEGWTEWSPFLEYEAAEAKNWLKAAIEFGWQKLPEIKREQIPVNITLPAVAADQVPGLLNKYSGPQTIKIKVAEPGQSFLDDYRRVQIVRELKPDWKIRVDANGAWKLDEAEENLLRLNEFRLEYAEQPCHSVAELAELRKRGTGVKIAADESIRKAEDPYLVAEAEAADLIVLKVQPLGGIRRALQLAEELKLPAVISSALESSIGIANGLALAAALPELDYACGLGTVNLFETDLAATPLVSETGWLPTGRQQIDREKLAQLRANPESKQHWEKRLTECYSLLAT